MYSRIRETIKMEAKRLKMKACLESAIFHRSITGRRSFVALNDPRLSELGAATDNDIL